MATNKSEQVFSPGMRVRIRDAEWFVRRVAPVKTGGQALYVRGITCPIQGRDQKRLAGYIRDGQNVALVGERRMDKTSLIYATCRTLRGYKMLYVDLLNIRTVADFCNRVATAAAQMGTKESSVSRAMRFMSRLRPTISVDPDNGHAGRVSGSAHGRGSSFYGRCRLAHRTLCRRRKTFRRFRRVSGGAKAGRW